LMVSQQCAGSPSEFINSAFSQLHRRTAMVGRRTVSLLRFLRLYHFAKEVADRKLQGKRLRFYAQFVSDGDLCFDVGANLGNRTDIFLGLGARVVAVEPQERCTRRLRRKYRNNGNVVLVPKGLDASNGVRTLRVCGSDGVSTMSEEWMRNVQLSGRFADLRWNGAEEVEVTTLENLISEFGCPNFCKIDVEGFELQVIEGLKTAIPCLSFEFTSEAIGPTIEIIRLLAGLGNYRFNYSSEESMKLAFEDWLPGDQIGLQLRDLSESLTFGDVYAKTKRDDMHGPRDP
jgi:FkbM family methyltransferase